MFEDTTISDSPPSSGGWSDFFSETRELLLDTAKEILPIWTRQELGLQQTPARTDQVLYQQYPGQPMNMDQLYYQQQQSPYQTGAPTVKPAFLDLNFGGTHVSGLAVAAIGVSILAALWLLRKA